MKGAIVAGALTFIGYHLVQRLLAEEVDVTALDFDDAVHPSKINEEKLLLIGRNARFSYHSLQSEEVWKEAECSEADVVYVCLCEPNQYASLPNEKRVHKVLSRLVSFCKESGKKLIMLSSVEASNARFYDREDMDVSKACENGTFFYKLETEIEKHVRNYSIVQVPTVYGPWQPFFMTYHQLIFLNVTNRPAYIDVQENSEDAVYVSDVAECLLQFGQKQHVKGTYHIQSKESGQWRKGVDLLKGRGKIRLHERHETKKATAPYLFDSKYSIGEGLAQQIKHTKKYKRLYEELYSKT